MKPREMIEAFIVIAVTIIYLILVINKVAQVEGFVVLATYIIKKFLDIIELKQDDKKEIK